MSCTFCRRTNKRSGFTLIELSIVLVIIGLIVGGVVGGKALIKSAEMQKIAQEMNQFSIMVRAFEMAYDAKPGDFKDASQYWPALTGGNGDGFIDQRVGANENETVYAWQHLNASEIYPNSHTTVGRPMESGKNTRPSALKGASWMFETWDFTGHPDDLVYQLKVIDFVMLGVEDGTWIDNPAISPSDASKLDKKVDDGIATTGRLMGHGGNLSLAECMTVTTPGNYHLSVTDKSCILLYRF